MLGYACLPYALLAPRRAPSIPDVPEDHSHIDPAGVDLRPLLEVELEGRYSVEREIASGGMATVFLVRDLRHDRHVALKIMRPGAAEGGAARFVREIGVTARLAHPHILPLLDSGVVEALPFYVMPFVDGETLRERIAREGRLSVTDAIHLAAEVADALAYAHAQGVVHRDIKPANILLSGRHAIVADFGVAKALAQTVPPEEVTAVGLAVGTLAYMSPEQSVGDADIDARSDIFSLAIVLFEMLVGEKAFGGTTVQEQMARRFSGIIPSARARRAEIPDEVDVVLTKALATDPDQRYTTAGEFESALLAATRQRPVFETGVIHIAREPDALPSIAVLPFVESGGPSQDAHLADGIAEEILTQLSLRRTMRVCARHSSFVFRDATVGVQAIAARLGVGHLLTGSVRRSATRLRVNVQLVDASTGFQRWAERYDREATDVFEIQDEIGAAVARALDATLLGEITQPTPTRRPPLEVYEALLKGRHLVNRRTPDAMERAIASFRAALDADGTYAPAWAGMAEAFVTQGVYGSVAPHEAFPRAREAAAAALAHDPSLAEARTVLAQCEAIENRAWESAEAMFRQAIALNPQLPAAHQGLAILASSPRGRHGEARQAIETALILDPLSPVLRTTQAAVALYAGDPGAAGTAARAVIDLEPGFAPAHFFLAQALLDMGEVQEAVQHATAAVEGSGGSSEALAVLALVSARAGRAGVAGEIEQRLRRIAASQYTSPTHLALTLMAQGRLDAAMDALDEAVTVGAADLAWLAVRPAWKPLHAHPRMGALLRQLHLTSG